MSIPTAEKAYELSRSNRKDKSFGIVTKAITEAVEDGKNRCFVLKHELDDELRELLESDEGGYKVFSAKGKCARFCISWEHIKDELD